jgi:hypothetical protein
MITSNKHDTRLRWWAIIALVLIGTIYALPASILEILVVRRDTNIIFRALIAGTLLVVILGFYLRMFFECAFSPGVYRRGGWLLLFILLPVFSGFVYFFVTRSRRYMERASSPHD